MNYVSGGIYRASALLLVPFGPVVAGTVLVVGLADVGSSLALNTGGVLKTGVKYVLGYDKMINSIEVQTNNQIQSIEPEQIQKFYNLTLQEGDLERAQEFDAKVKAAVDFANSAKTAVNDILTGISYYWSGS